MVRYLFYTIGDLTYQSPLVKSHMLSSRIRVIAVADTARKLLEHDDGWNSNADLVHMMLSTKTDLPLNFQDVIAHGHFTHLSPPNLFKNFSTPCM